MIRVSVWSDRKSKFWETNFMLKHLKKKPFKRRRGEVWVSAFSMNDVVDNRNSWKITKNCWEYFPTFPVHIIWIVNSCRHPFIPPPSPPPPPGPLICPPSCPRAIDPSTCLKQKEGKKTRELARPEIWFCPAWQRTDRKLEDAVNLCYVPLLPHFPLRSRAEYSIILHPNWNRTHLGSRNKTKPLALSGRPSPLV